MKLKTILGFFTATLISSAAVAGGHMNKSLNKEGYESWKHELAVKLHLSEEQIGFLNEYVKESRDKKRVKLAEKCGVDLNAPDKTAVRKAMVMCMKDMK